MPNLYAPYSEYHADLSKTGSTIDIPLENLILTYQGTSSTTVRISIAPKTTGVSVLADLRRTTIYNSNTIETLTLDNTAISARRVLDDIVYNQSQKTHSMRNRQQDPETKRWSLCEIGSFLSGNGARTSVWVRWIEYDVEYEAPATV